MAELCDLYQHIESGLMFREHLKKPMTQSPVHKETPFIPQQAEVNLRSSNKVPNGQSR